MGPCSSILHCIGLLNHSFLSIFSEIFFSLPSPCRNAHHYGGHEQLYLQHWLSWTDVLASWMRSGCRLSRLLIPKQNLRNFSVLNSKFSSGDNSCSFMLGSDENWYRFHAEKKTFNEAVQICKNDSPRARLTAVKTQETTWDKLDEWYHNALWLCLPRLSMEVQMHRN